MISDAQILRGRADCARCNRIVPAGASRAILYLSPQHWAIACIECSQQEAGLNHELVRSVPLVLRTP